MEGNNSSTTQSVQPQRLIQVATLNIENVKSNHAFTNTTLQNQDILAIQEHWLYKFEKDRIKTLLPSWNPQIRCVDENNPLQNSHIPGGHGGVATLWKPWLEKFVHKVEEGNERILVTLLDIPKQPLCVINCYLSSGTSSGAVSTFTEDLASLKELIIKYSDRYEVMVLGDLNEDHFNRNGKKEKLMSTLIAETGLIDLGRDCAEDPTYINSHLKHASHIDHILIKPLQQRCMWKAVQIMDHESDQASLNSSKHSPLFTAIPLSNPTTAGKGNKTATKMKQATRRSYKWKEADPHLYAGVITDELETYNLTVLQPEDALRSFQTILDTAACTAVPYEDKKVNPTPPNKVKWTPMLASAVQLSKIHNYRWKQGGRPTDGPLWVERKRANKQTRAVQRQQEAGERRDLIQSISLAAGEDQTLFHKLIKRQRGKSQVTDTLFIDGEKITDEEQIRKEMANYYEKLSNREEDESEAARMLDYMRQLCALSPESTQITPTELQTIINSLSSGKATDKDGYCAEHLKLLPEIGITTLTVIFNQILSTRKVPNILKEAYKLPIPKPDKDCRLQDNYRGITITSVFCKVLELVVEREGGEDLNRDTSGLQCGFTAGRSPSMASLIVTEAIVEAKEKKEDLFIVTLDARKAFDVVSHSKLKAKLFQTSISPPLWGLIDDLYVNNQEVVRWCGIDSRSYQVSQGVRQGGILSPSLYKIYINDLLKSLQKLHMGLHIGSVYVGTPTCADDVLLLSSCQFQTQAMVNTTHAYSEEHLYELHPTKSLFQHQIKGKTKQLGDKLQCYMNNSAMNNSSSFTHLGLDWHAGKSSPDVMKRISAARGLAYAMLGVGLHGHDGLDPAASMATISMYVTPRLLHGLEAAVLSKQQLNDLDKYYKTLLRQVQGLPENVATEFIYLLIGSLPVIALWHKRVLSLLGNIARLGMQNPLHQLAVRQMACKDMKSKSWFIQVVSIGEMYGIDVRSALIHPWPKLAWKKHVKSLVHEHWITTMTQRAEERSTLKWWLPVNALKGMAQPIWTSCKGKPYQVTAATSRARMLAGRYHTQSSKAKFSQGKLSPTCQLCGEEEENIEHFLCRCSALQKERVTRIKDLKTLYQEEGLLEPTTDEEMTSAILNGGAFEISVGSQHSENCNCNCSKQNVCKHKSNNSASNTYIVMLTEHHIVANQLCNLICHRLHIQRDTVLSDILLEGGSPDQAGGCN